MSDIITVYELGTDNEFHYINVDPKTALLSAYAVCKGYISNLIKNNYESIDGVSIVEGEHSYSIGDFTVIK